MSLEALGDLASLAGRLTCTEAQQTYERLFGAQPEWHPADQQNEPTSDDDDLYRRLFGDTLKGNER